MAERRNKNINLGKGGKCDSHTSSNNKALKTLREQTKKFKRQIKALKRTDCGKDNDSEFEDNNNDPSDAGYAFGGHNRKKPKKKI